MKGEEKYGNYASKQMIYTASKLTNGSSCITAWDTYVAIEGFVA